MDELEYIGNFIKLHREMLDLNVNQLAYKCKYSRSYISLIEKGKIHKSEKLEYALDIIFTQLKLNYQEFKNKSILYREKINNFILAILDDVKDEGDRLFSDLLEKESLILSYDFSPRYWLGKFVYFISRNITSDLEQIVRTLQENVDIYNQFDKNVLYTYLGIYYRNKGNTIASDKYLCKALKLGRFEKISGITHYQYAITLTLEHRLILAYTNIHKANRCFYEEKNFNRLMYSIVQEAIIFRQGKEYEKARELLNELLFNSQVTEEISIFIKSQIAQISVDMKDYREALHIYDSLVQLNDDSKFKKLYSYYQLSNETDFCDYYETIKYEMNDEILKQQIDILWSNFHHNTNDEDYIEILLNNLQSLKDNEKIERKIFVIDEIIDFYTSRGKYKYANKYLLMKMDVLCL
ncbi:helix-turn-helix domain-containing protein [Amedibacillus sp. YH-ame10]